MGYNEHKEFSAEVPVRSAVVTVSDTRTPENDHSGALIKARLAEHGHVIAAYRVVPDQPEMIGDLLDELTRDVDVVIINGGTGISKRDTTFEAVSSRLEKNLPGFGELFRMLSYQDIGPGAMLSRATAGVYRDTLIFSIPGSTGAVRLAVDRLILPELRHLVWEILRQKA